MTAATLPYQDKFWHGLRINPSFDEVLESTKKKIKYQLPDRSAKWFVTSVYLSFMSAARRYHDTEHLKLDYNQTESRLPQAAAMVTPAVEGGDPAWDRMRGTSDAADEHDFIERGFAELEAERRRQAEQQRRYLLASQAAAAFAPALFFIGDHHEELEEAGVEHDAPATLPTFPALDDYPIAEPIVLPAAAGHVGALTQFPTFEELNYREGNIPWYAAGPEPETNYGSVRRPRNPIFRINPQDSGYERMRDSARGQ
jgi:hypothetical protein